MAGTTGDVIKKQCPPLPSPLAYHHHNDHHNDNHDMSDNMSLLTAAFSDLHIYI